MTCLYENDLDARAQAAPPLLLRAARFRPGHLFELDPLLAVLTGKVLRYDSVSLTFAVGR